MPTIIVTQRFLFAHGGIRVEAFEPSAEPVETTQECADVALAEGWAHLGTSSPAGVVEPGAPENAAAAAAPQNHDAAAAPRRKRKSAPTAPAA
jgi:hypothetical protein